jgi:hypothetical protein
MRSLTLALLTVVGIGSLAYGQPAQSTPSGPQEVSVLGNVRSPGRYSVESEGTTVEAIVQRAGGVLVQGSPLILFRTSGPMAYACLATLKTTVRAGDTVVVSNERPRPSAQAAKPCE